MNSRPTREASQGLSRVRWTLRSWLGDIVYKFRNMPDIMTVSVSPVFFVQGVYIFIHKMDIHIVQLGKCIIMLLCTTNKVRVNTILGLMIIKVISNLKYHEYSKPRYRSYWLQYILCLRLFRHGQWATACMGSCLVINARVPHVCIARYERYNNLHQYILIIKMVFHVNRNLTTI